MPIELAPARRRASALAGLRPASLPHAVPRADRFERDVHCLLGLPVDALDLAGAAASVQDAIARRLPCFLSTPNVNFAVRAARDEAFRDSLLASDLSLADGMPLVWIARLLGIPLRERVAGADLFERLKRGEPRPLSVYFFGGEDGVAETASRALNEERSRLACVGFESPGQGDVPALSLRSSIARINASGADFLVVALGAQKGQRWIEHNLPRLAVPVVSHLGAVVNFAARRIRRAPAWMRSSGLEWLWRIREEHRLLGRYLSDGAMFFKILLVRVLPLAWALRRQKPRGEDLQAARIETHDTEREIVLRLRGAWTRENLAPLRAAYRRAADAHRHIRLDLGRVSYVDTAFLGLTLVLHGAQRRSLRRLACGPLSRPVQKIFHYAGVDFLVPAAAPGATPDVALEEAEQPLGE